VFLAPSLTTRPSPYHVLQEITSRDTGCVLRSCPTKYMPVPNVAFRSQLSLRLAYGIFVRPHRCSVMPPALMQSLPRTHSFSS